MNRIGIGFSFCPWLTKESVTNVQLLRQKGQKFFNYMDLELSDREFSTFYPPFASEKSSCVEKKQKNNLLTTLDMVVV